MALEEKVQQLLARLPGLEEELGDPGVVNDRDRFKKITQEHAYLSDLKVAWEELSSSKKQLQEGRDLLRQETDEAFLEMAREEISSIEEVLPDLEKKVELLLVPPDPNDSRNTVLEIRAGTGGDEAALFVADCVRMYRAFADSQNWKCEELSSTPSDLGGYREYAMVISGANVYRILQYEAGTHRVQRVPETETQGRVHTSAVTVAALMEPDEEEEVQIDEKDLRIDTYRSSGAGGQHVNTTDSAVRITHLPSGIVVCCQEERSQIKNRAKAMRYLSAKLAEEERSRKAREMADTRASQVGSGDRSERIRTYNFPQNRVTDHRINLTLYSLDSVMNGELQSVSDALVAHFHQKKLEAAG